MTKNEVTVKKDFETRVAARFVQLAGKFEANVQIEVDGKKTNCKSLMGVIAVGVCEGKNVILSADGADAEAAVSELCAFLGSI